VPFFLPSLDDKGEEEREREINRENWVVLVGEILLKLESPPFGLLAFGPLPQLFAENQ
jgi:hypothetical protein